MQIANAPRVAIVDADRRVQSALAELLRVAGVEVVGTAGDVRSALVLAEESKPGAMIVDPRLPDLDAGLALVSSLHRGWPALRIVLTGWADRGEPRWAENADHFVAKSAGPDAFVAAVLGELKPTVAA